MGCAVTLINHCEDKAEMGVVAMVEGMAVRELIVGRWFVEVYVEQRAG